MTNTIADIITKISGILGSLLPLLISLGVVYFIWGVVQYVIADGEEAKDKGKNKIIYGIIGFAVIIGLWGLVNIIVVTFGLSAAAPAPQLLKVTNVGTCQPGSSANVKDILCYITKLINDSIIPLIFAIAVLAFIWGVLQFFILNPDEEAKRAQGRQFMIWGIVALAVMISVWGLVGILQSTFFGSRSSVLPQVCPPGGCK